MIINAICLVVFSIATAVCDKLQHHHGKSVFKKTDPYSFWGKNSWVRKYKHNNPANGKEKFFQSTASLVWLTDGWHLVKTIQILSVFVAIVFGRPVTEGMPWYYGVGEVIVMAVIYGGVFELFYSFILHKK